MRWLAMAAAAVIATSAMAQTTPASLFVFIYRQGPSWKADTPMREQPSMGAHGAYMKRLFDEGRSFAAGPLTDTLGGIVIIRAASLDEAKSLLAQDPGVASGMFVAEAHAWSPAFRSDQPLPATR